MNIGERIKTRRNELGYSVDDIAKQIGKNRATIYRYESSEIEDLPTSVLEPLAKALHTTPAYLMGWEENPRKFPANLIPLNTVTYIPLVGTIACGTPIFAEQNIKSKILLPDNIKADFALTCKGDSMINAGIENGDIVYIRMQPEVGNGEIAAVQIEDFDTEATLKKIHKTDSSITLIAENPNYEPMVFIKEEMNRVKILGKCVAILRNLEDC